MKQFETLIRSHHSPAQKSPVARPLTQGRIQPPLHDPAPSGSHGSPESCPHSPIPCPPSLLAPEDIRVTPWHLPSCCFLYSGHTSSRFCSGTLSLHSASAKMWPPHRGLSWPLSLKECSLPPGIIHLQGTHWRLTVINDNVYAVPCLLPQERKLCGSWSLSHSSLCPHCLVQCLVLNRYVTRIFWMSRWRNHLLHRQWLRLLHARHCDRWTVFIPCSLGAHSLLSKEKYIYTFTECDKCYK